MNNNQTFYPPINRIVKINSFKIVDVRIDLFEKATFRVLLFDADGKLADNKFYQLTPEEYSEWGTDDQYLVKYVKTKLSEQKSEDNTQN
jgi:hypothetical protein